MSTPQPRRALRALVSTAFLTPLDDGRYGRADLQTAVRLPETAQRQAIGMVLAPVWTRVFGDVRRGPVHVRVTAGSPTDELLRVARDIEADLIVLGRADAGRALSLTRLRELLRQAPGSVLIVRPSGQAAVTSPSACREDAARAR